MDMTKKLTKDLIEMYWERKCLWQVNSKEYKKRDMKKKAYHEIVLFLRKNGVKDATAKLVRDKIQNLRRAMRKEKKRIDGSGGTYSPTLWYYDLLIFVNDQYEDTAQVNSSSKTSDSNSEVICADTEEDIDENNIYDNVEILKIESTATIQDKDVNKHSMKIIVDNPIDEKETICEFKAIGINFTAKLKRMESRQQIFAELLIQKVLAKGLLGQLNDTTDVLDKV